MLRADGAAAGADGKLAGADRPAVRLESSVLLVKSQLRRLGDVK